MTPSPYPHPTPAQFVGHVGVGESIAAVVSAVAVLALLIAAPSIWGWWRGRRAARRA
jgi:hypothetical protein